MRLSLKISLILLNLSANAYSQESWNCNIQDTSNAAWNSISTLKQKAASTVLEQCRKQSSNPESCMMNNVQCLNIENYSSGIRIQCSVLDFQGTAWSGISTQTDTAMMRAKAKCKKYSALPYTCHINFITCVNKGL